jgi:hypothetical protein
MPNTYRAELTDKSQYWIDRAEECRTLAELLRAPDAREQMFRIADAYTRLAARATEG